MIDLRSDTMTQPTEAMRQAMRDALVGDDMYGEDPTIAQLEQQAAQLLGKPAALFVSSCSQANLIAQLSQIKRGQEILCSEKAHVHAYEQGAASSIASLRTRQCKTAPDGTFELSDALIPPEDVHFPHVGMVWVEQTYWGKVLPLSFMQEAVAFASKHKLKLHIDGARLFNAASKLNVAPSELVQGADSISICLSKGLGAPAGSLLVGSQDLIFEARRWRKALGGAWRQGGVLAAAGLIGLESWEKLAEDHAKVDQLAALLDLPEDPTRSNMLFVPCKDPDQAVKELKKEGILVLSMNPLRLVFHKDVPSDAAPKIAESLKRFL